MIPWGDEYPSLPSPTLLVNYINHWIPQNPYRYSVNQPLPPRRKHEAQSIQTPPNGDCATSKIYVSGLQEASECDNCYVHNHRNPWRQNVNSAATIFAISNAMWQKRRLPRTIDRAPTTSYRNRESAASYDSPTPMPGCRYRSSSTVSEHDLCETAGSS